MNKCDYDYKPSTVRRREEIAFPYFQGYTAREIAEYSIYSKKTVEKDIIYIEAHLEEFLG